MAIHHYGERKPGNPGNDVIRTISEDPLLGYDQYDQFWVYEKQDEGIKRWIVRNLSASLVKCPICQQGWEATNASLKNQARIDSMERFAHSTCMNGYRHVREFFFWHGLFCEQGVNYFGIEFKEIENQYWPKASGYPTDPWFRVRLRHAPHLTFEVGARKRVYCITVEGMDEAFAKIVEGLFADVKDTKQLYAPSESEKRTSWHWLVHAWTNEQAKDYIRRIAKLLPPPAEEQREAATTEHYAAEREKREPAPW